MAYYNLNFIIANPYDSSELHACIREAHYQADAMQILDSANE